MIQRTLKQAAITSVHGFVPEYRLTNAELETMVDTSDEWILSRTGIAERRLLKGDRATSDMGVEVVKGLLEKSGYAAEEIDMVICATCTPDMQIPDTANTICDKAGLTNAFGFDINAACSGFLFALETAAQYIATSKYSKIIVVGADKMSSVINYEDRTTCIIFGDGAGGVLLEPTDDMIGILDSKLCGDGSGREFLYLKAGGSKYPLDEESLKNKENYVVQEGRAVFKSAVKGMVSTVKEVMENNHLTTTDVAWLVPHQANMRIIGALSDMMDFPMDKVMVNIQQYGNTTAGTIPLCLWDWESKLKKGDNLILTAFGGGFTWGAVYLKWAYDPE